MTGRQRRRLYEEQELMKLAARREDIDIKVTRKDADGIALTYTVYYQTRSICGIDEDEAPVFAKGFTMLIDLPDDYPQVDAPPAFRFIKDSKHALPWHPNIRYHGDMAGHVCLNALNTFTDLAWGVERVALYLRYELYHALPEPPYPEDLVVAAWVRKVGEPEGYVFFDQ